MAHSLEDDWARHYSFQINFRLFILFNLSQRFHFGGESRFRLFDNDVGNKGVLHVPVYHPSYNALGHVGHRECFRRVAGIYSAVARGAAVDVRRV